MAQQIQIRRGTAADAVAADPVLAEGEQGYETDTGVVKIGDGTTPWASLPVAFTVGDNATSALIGERVLTSASATVEFLDIAQDYSDLFVSAIVRTDRAAVSDGFVMLCNGDNTAGNYDYSRIITDGSTVATAESTTQSFAFIGDVWGNTASAGRYAPVSVHLPGFSSATFMKAFQSEVSRITDGFGIWTSLWKSTAPITSLTFKPGVGANLLAGTEIRLYGIR